MFINFRNNHKCVRALYHVFFHKVQKYYSMFTIPHDTPKSIKVQQL